MTKDNENKQITRINPYVIKYHLLEAKKELEQLQAYYDSFFLIDPELSENEEQFIFYRKTKLTKIIAKINEELQND